MADEIVIKSPAGGASLNGAINLTVNGLDLVDKAMSTLNKVANDKKLQNYWKSQDKLIEHLSNTYREFNRNASQSNAEELIKTSNALKAMLGTEEEMRKSIPDYSVISESVEEATQRMNNLGKTVDSAFSVSSFKDAFTAFELMTDHGAELEVILSKLDTSQLTESLRVAKEELRDVSREYQNLKQSFSFALSGDDSEIDVDSVKKQLRELNKVRMQAQEEFNEYLKGNGFGSFAQGGDYDYRTEEYFSDIERGYLTSREAISNFRAEFSHLYEDTKNGFSTESIDILLNKLEEMFTLVESISVRMNDIIENGVISKGISNLAGNNDLNDYQRQLFSNLFNDEESLKNISNLISGIIENSIQLQSSSSKMFSEEEFKEIVSLFDEIKNALLSIKETFSSVGEDGNTFNPLLSSLEKVIESIKKVKTEVGKLSFNIDITPNNIENDEFVTKAKGNLLSAYKAAAQQISYSTLPDSIAGAFRNGSSNYINFEQFQDIDVVLGMYEKELNKINSFFERAAKIRNEYYEKEGIKKQPADKWQNYAKNEARLITGAKTSLTNQRKKLDKEVVENNNNLHSLFGDNSAELQAMISQIGTIIEELRSMSSVISNLSNDFRGMFDSLNMSVPIQEISEMTEKIKQLESQVNFLNNNASLKPFIEQENITGARKDEIRFFDSDHIVKSIESEYGNLENSISKEISELLKNSGDKSLDEIKNSIIRLLTKSSKFIEGITGVSSNDLNDNVSEVSNFIRKSNIKYDESYKQEFGDDWNKVNATIGLMSKNGTDLMTILSECNTVLGTSFDLTQDNQTALRELYNYLTSKSTISVSELPAEIKKEINEIIEAYTGYRREYSSNNSSTNKSNYKNENSSRIYNENNRDIISQNGLKQTYKSTDEEGNEITVGEFSFIERLKDGQLQNVLVKYNEEMNQWVETTVSLNTAFEKVGNEILSLDEKINKYKIDRDKMLSEHQDYDSSADEELISLAERRRGVLLDTLKIYKDQPQYVYEINKFEEKRIENNKRLQALKTRQENTSQVKEEEKQEKAEDKKRIAVERTNKTLDSQLQKIKNIQASYDKSISPGIKRAVNDQSDLTILNTKFGDIESSINGLRNKEATITEIQNIENLISEYRRLAKIKIETNNVSDKELASKNLDVAVAELVAKYKKLIAESKNYGESSENITSQLESQLRILEETDKLTGKRTVDAKAFYAAQATYKTDKADLSTIKSDENRKKTYEDLLRTIEEFSKVKKRIANGKELDGDVESAELLKTRINELQNRPILSRQQLESSLQKLFDLYDELDLIEKKIGKIQEKQLDSNKTKAIKFTQDSIRKVQKNISKYSYGNSSEANELIQKLNRGVSNFGDMSDVDGTIRKLSDEIDLIISNLSKSHKENLNNIKEEIKEEEKLNKEKEKKQNDTKSREQLKVYNELVDTLSRYETVSKRIAKNEALATDVYEASELQEKIEVLQNSPILSNEQLDNSIRKLDKIEQNIIDIQEQTRNKNIKSRETEIDNYQAKLDRMMLVPKDINQSEQYKNAINDVRESLEKLKEAYNEVRNASDEEMPEKISNYEKVKDALEKYINVVKTMPSSEKGSKEIARAKEIEKINDLLKKNTKYSSQAKKELKEFMNQLENGNASLNLETIHNRVLSIARAEREAGREGKSFLDILGSKVVYSFATRLATYYLSFMDIIRYTRIAISTIKELDTALVDLKKTTKMSSSELENFYTNSSNIAKQVGITTSELISQASAWSRLGYSTEEASVKMAKLSSQFASISPDMDTSEATDGMVSTMKAFGIEVEDVERKIMDNINRIGNTAATTNGEIIDMLTRSSAAMSAANNTIEETIALETAAVEITRNAETTGTAFRTISMRIRGYDEDTEELSDDLKNISGDIADLTKTAKTPGGISLFTDENKSEYKSTYKLLEEISEIYNDLTDKQQAELLEKLGGKRGGQVIAGTLSNFDAAKNAIKNMEEAAGSADAEMEVIYDSIDYKLNALKQTWVGIMQDAIDRGDIGKLVDLFTKLSESIAFIVDNVGALATIGGIAGAIFGFKYDLKPISFIEDRISDIKSIVDNTVLKFNEMNNSSLEVSDNLSDISQDIVSETNDVLSDEDIQMQLFNIDIDTEEIAGNLADSAQDIISEANDILSDEDIQMQILNIGANEEEIVSENQLTEAITANSVASSSNASTKEQEAIASAILSAGLDAETYALMQQLTGEEALTEAGLRRITEMTAEEATARGVSMADYQLAKAKAAVVLENYEIATSSRLAAAGEALLTAGLGMLAGYALSKIIGVLSDIAYESENLGNRVKEVKQSFNSLLSSANEYDKKSRELISDFERLSDGVDLLGHNVSLTDDEFETYKDISNQIAEMFPTLIKGWDDQGNAILRLRDNMELLNESSKDLKISAYSELINGNSESGTKGADDILKAYKKAFDNYSGKYALKSAAEEFLNVNNVDEFSTLAGKYKDRNIEGYSDFVKSTGVNKARVKELSEKELADIKRNIKIYLSQIDNELEEEVKNVRTVADAYFNYALLTDDKYSDILNNGKVRDSISSMISSMDSDFINKNNLYDKNILQDYVNNILDIVSDPENGEKASKAIAGLFSVDYSDMPLDEAKEIIDGYIKYLAKLLGEDYIELKIRFGFTQVDDTYNNLISAREKAVGKFSSSSTEDYVRNELDDFAKENSINTQDEIAFWNKCIEESDTREEAMQKYLESTVSDGTFGKLSITDTVTQLKEQIKPAFDEIANAYNDVFENNDKSNFDLSKVDIDTLDSIKSAIEGLNEVDGINIPMERFEEFATVLTNTDSTAEEVQEQFDHLVDVILSASAIEVTGENFDILRQTLTQLGVTNAEEVLNNIATASELCTKYGYNLNEVTVEQINHIIDEEGALLGEGNAYEDTINAMIDYYLTKIKLNNNPLDVSKDLEALEALYNALGNTAEEAALLSKIKIAQQMIEDVGVNMGENARNSLNAQIDQWMQQLLDSRTYSFEHHYGGGNNNNNNSGSGNDSDNQTEEIFDWIEVRLKRLQEALQLFENTATDTFKSLSKRVGAYGSAISTLTDEINTQTQAQERYMQEANSVGLAEEWASKVRDGSLDISKITDETLKEQIQKYQEWYEKAKACGDVIDELNKKLTDLKLAKIQLEIDIDQRSLTKLQSKLDKLQFRLDLSQLFGGLGSASTYNAMNLNNQQQIQNLNHQNDLIRQQMELVEKGSEAWENYRQQISDNESSIRQLLQTIAQNEQALANLRNERRDQRNEERDRKDELDNLRMQNSSTNLNRQNRYSRDEQRRIDARLEEYNNAVNDNKQSLKDAKSNISKIKSNKENKDILKEVRKYTKAKKEIPTSLLEKAAKLNDNGVLYTALVKYNAALAALETSQEDRNLYREQAQQDRINQVRQRMSNIETYYGNRTGMLDQRATRVNNAISLAEAQGYVASTGYYEELRRTERAKNNTLVKERDKLQEQLNKGMKDGTIKQYSAEWYELVQRIDDVTNAIDESNLAMQEYENTIRQIKWDRFDRLQEKIKAITTEINFLINELSRGKLTDDETGWLTREGRGVAALHLSNYNVYMQEIDNYKKELKKIQKDLAKDPTNQTLKDREEELQQAIRDNITAAEDEKYAIIDLWKQGYDALISRVSKLINEYNELLDAEKDAYDYQNKINDATKNISNIKKQLAAYAGDDSEENRARIQKLTVELENAEKDLKDMQYEHMISEQKKMLSEFQEDLQEKIDDIIDNLDDNFDKLIKEINSDDGALRAIRNEISNLNYNPTDSLEEILTGGVNEGTGDAIDGIIDYQERIANAAESIARLLDPSGSNTEQGKTNFKTEKKNAKNAITEAKKNLDSFDSRETLQSRVATSLVKYSNTEDEYKDKEKEVKELQKIYESSIIKGKDGNYASDAEAYNKWQSALKELESLEDIRNMAKKNYEASVAELNAYDDAKKKYEDTQVAYNVMKFLETRLSSTATQRSGLNDINKVFYDNFGQTVISDSEMQELAELLGVKMNGTNTSSKLYKKLKEIGIPGFKIGTRNMFEKQLALLGEEGMELQFHKAQGTLGVVGQGDKIFTNEQAENLWKLSKMNPYTIGNNTSSTIPSILSIYSPTQTIAVSIGDIMLPNVTDPEQFATSLKDVIKNDNTVQKILKDSTIGSLSKNSNSFSIRKY